MAHFDMVQLVDYLDNLLYQRFSNDVSNIYFGDIGIYLPSSFGGSRQDQKAIIALSPAYDHLVERVANFETRLLGIDIIVMVNITPFFEANPQEAYGERMLVRIVTDVATFLTQEENVNLHGNVHFTTVGDIDWTWIAKGQQAIRAAGIAYEARVRIPRM